jgi:hypothetical protein
MYRLAISNSALKPVDTVHALKQGFVVSAKRVKQEQELLTLDSALTIELGTEHPQSEN